MKKILDFLIGFFILISFYFISYFIIKFLHITLPPAILGIILFSIALINGIIKEERIKTACDFLIQNMAMFLVPFMGGLIVYKSTLARNWLVIFLVIFLTTTLTIVITGLFVEWGLILIRLYKIKKLQKSGGYND